MAKQIDGQLSFDFMDTFNTKEISMDDYMNKPENMDTKKKMDSKKHTSEVSSTNEMKSVEKAKSSDEKPIKEKGTKIQATTAKFIPNYEEFYIQATDYVTEHRGITVGTIMRLYQLSAINASELFHRLIDNKVVDESGRFYKEKKEL